MGVFEHLCGVVRRVFDADVDDVARVVELRGVDRVDEPGVGCDVQGRIAFEDLGMELRIDLDAVAFDQLATRRIIALGFDPLDFAQQFAEQASQFVVIVHHDIGFPPR